MDTCLYRTTSIYTKQTTIITCSRQSVRLDMCFTWGDTAWRTYTPPDCNRTWCSRKMCKRFKDDYFKGHPIDCEPNNPCTGMPKTIKCLSPKVVFYGDPAADT